MLVSEFPMKKLNGQSTTTTQMRQTKVAQVIVFPSLFSFRCNKKILLPITYAWMITKSCGVTMQRDATVRQERLTMEEKDLLFLQFISANGANYQHL
jgi:hypothetical protein